jgi:hypothetical protein
MDGERVRELLAVAGHLLEYVLGILLVVPLPCLIVVILFPVLLPAHQIPAAQLHTLVVLLLLKTQQAALHKLVVRRSEFLVGLLFVLVILVVLGVTEQHSIEFVLTACCSHFVITTQYLNILKYLYV